VFQLQTPDSTECNCVKFAIERKERSVHKWLLYCRDVKSVCQVRRIGRRRRCKVVRTRPDVQGQNLWKCTDACVCCFIQTRTVIIVSWFIPPPRPLTVVRNVFRLVSVSDLKVSYPIQMSEYVVRAFLYK
jgi:hypothetical protein